MCALGSSLIFCLLSQFLAEKNSNLHNRLMHDKGGFKLGAQIYKHQ